jgi:predicted nucleic acid-binding protein
VPTSAEVTIWYLDTSAMAKLVQPEVETRALRRWLASRRWIVSDLHRTELCRAAARVGGRALARAERLLAESDVLRIDADVFDKAGRVGPATLRSLDALHIAAATSLGPDLAGIVVYDARLHQAASDAGIAAVSPGRHVARSRSAR